MLNIGKLRRGGENYYLNAVARGVEDYYLGSGEAPGYWLASGAADLELHGEVGELELRRVLSGCHPASGTKLVKPTRNERVPGFDLTFRAPKSVALLHELGSGETSKEVMRAHDAAVAAALSYLERQASGARRGHGGKRSIESKGFIAAAFRHRTSRAGDPLLHTHALAANLIHGSDGRWGAVDAQHLYRHAKTAGYLYQAHLRAELTRRLGVAWTPVIKGSADIDGIPRSVIRAFSKRRKEMEELLGDLSEVTRREAEVAALTTRQAKDYKFSPQSLAPEWRARAEALGLTREMLDATLGLTRYVSPSAQQLGEIAIGLAGPEGLTEKDSAFSRREVLQGFCSGIQTGAAIEEIEAMADGFCESDLVIPLTIRPERRYSTPEMMEVERSVIAGAIGRRLEGAGVAIPTAVEGALKRRPSMFPDQQAMVRSLTTSGRGVEVVVGKAGTGKTFALDAAREAWEASGQRVIGCCLAARAAEELEFGAGIPSSTIRLLLLDLADPESGGLARGSVLVVDEAAMVGTRDLARLLDHAQRADAKVVLVGDDRQLPPIDAGGAFRGIMNRLPPIELSEVRRQPEGWERDALNLVREGRSQEAFDAYAAHDRVVVARSAEETRVRLIADWWVTSEDQEPAVILAARRSDVADLNARARMMMRAAGRLGREEIEFGDVCFAVGDRVMTLHNDRRLGVKNGNRGTIECIDSTRREITFRRDDGKVFKLSRSYLEEGNLTHGYAMTGHKSQAMTTAKAYVLADQTLYQEWAYVAMSRGRNDNRLYVVAGVDPEREEVGGEMDKVSDPTKELIRALGRSRAKDLAIDVFEDSEIHHLSMTELRREWEVLSNDLGGAPPDPASELERIASERSKLEAVLEREGDVAQRATKELHELGLIARRRQRAEVSRLSHRIQDASQTEARTLVELDRLDEEEAKCAEMAGERERWLVENGPAVRRRYALERELWWREHQNALAAEVAMPTYLSDVVGQRPDRPSERTAWQEAVRAIEAYRSRWAITDATSALGRWDATGKQARQRDEVEALLADTQEQARHQEQIIERSLDL